MGFRGLVSNQHLTLRNYLVQGMDGALALGGGPQRSPGPVPVPKDGWPGGQGAGHIMLAGPPAEHPPHRTVEAGMDALIDLQASGLDQTREFCAREHVNVSRTL